MWKKSKVSYTPCELMGLYWGYKDAGFTRIRPFFFGNGKPMYVDVELKRLKQFNDKAQRTLYSKELTTNIKGTSYNDMRNLMYMVPFKKVPLFINIKGLKPIVKWRLEIGR